MSSVRGRSFYLCNRSPCVVDMSNSDTTKQTFQRAATHVSQVDDSNYMNFERQLKGFSHEPFSHDSLCSFQSLLHSFQNTASHGEDASLVRLHLRTNISALKEDVFINSCLTRNIFSKWQPLPDSLDARLLLSNLAFALLDEAGKGTILIARDKTCNIVFKLP
jgi:hypothetical protein